MDTPSFPRWQFWIDRGGTFTDIVARHPEGYLLTHKLLSEHPKYPDAAIQGIRNILGLTSYEALPTQHITSVKMGTTVATNALLERQGEPTALVITQGFKDALRIAYQNRPELFALQILLPPLLYQQVIEIDERITAQGEVLKPIALKEAKAALLTLYQQGFASIAIVLMHGYRYPQHEQQLASLAREIGFRQVSVSHEVSPLSKLIRRGETTVVDAYLSPILQRYVDAMLDSLEQVDLLFMQSHGGLTKAQHFRGKDAILSGPAGGYVGAVKTSTFAGLRKIINFDMGGTSTDVSHYAGEYERDFESQIAGAKICVPMIKIHTIAAGGGSLIYFDGSCFHVGPDSAGAFPGPACYRQGGPLTITDCNVMLGKLHGRFFPKVFGEQGQSPIDEEIVKEKFAVLTQQINQSLGRSYVPIEVAEGFIQVAVVNMATAIKKISVQRGYDVTEYTLCCFGAAAGQHACLVAESLGIKTIFIHAQAGVLSALGMGLAEVRSLHEKTMATLLEPHLDLEHSLEILEQQGRDELFQQQVNVVSVHQKVHLRYAGTDTGLWVKFSPYETMKQDFTHTHQQRYGFIRTDQALVVEAVSVEVVGVTNPLEEILRPPQQNSKNPPHPLDQVHMVSHGRSDSTPVYQRGDLPCGFKIVGPAILIEETNTLIVEPHWHLEVTEHQNIFLSHHPGLKSEPLHTSHPDPIRLEIFKHLFMSIAEQMGATLENTAYSVNIKERLDFSCAIFDSQGQLVANAPHIPIHLGSMGDSVQSIIQENPDLHPGDVFILNDPYRGGTHLPDITVISPIFDISLETSKVLFYVASRGHHADIGGLTPGSMPPQSQTLEEEGIVIPPFKLVDQGQLQEHRLRKLLCSGPYPVRNVEQNLADLRAQIAANATGVRELHHMIRHFGQEVVHAYMQHVQNHAQTCIEQLLTTLKSGTFHYELDQGAVIQVKITIEASQRMATIDFTGTSPQQTNNFNAPISVCKSAILYVFRSLLSKDIPLNAGCLKPLQLIIPKGSLLCPTYPAAVVAGNVETSQAIVDTLYGALGIMAASQGTMNNFTFGNEKYQYYETLCGGSGAGPGFHGTSAVHTHMTNSRLTDPEVLEDRFPVLLESFSIRDRSGGEGQFHGGDGVVRKIRFREAMMASILSTHRRIPPYGMLGGAPGKIGKNWVQRIDGTREDLAGTTTVHMQPEEILVIETPGGGGYGTPPDELVSILR